LQQWIKFYETITKPLPVASSLFLIISTMFLLTASDSALLKLGMSRVLTDYRWVVGLLFVIALTWLVVTALIWLGKWFYRQCQVSKAKRRVETEIAQMTPREREIVSYLLANDQRVFTNTIDGGYAVTLISKKIIACALLPGQAFTQLEVPFEVPDYVWDVLVKHKAKFPYTPPKSLPWRVPWDA